MMRLGPYCGHGSWVHSHQCGPIDGATADAEYLTPTRGEPVDISWERAVPTSLHSAHEPQLPE